MIILISCSTSKETVSETKDKSDGYTFTIQLTKTGAYCGGVSPAPEMLKELNTPKPLTLTSVYLRKGEVNDVSKAYDFSFTSNEQGIIEGELPEGVYSIVFKEKKDSIAQNKLISAYKNGTINHSAINLKCLNEYFAQPDGSITINKGGGNTTSVNKRDLCPWDAVPCTSYKGSYPPSNSTR